MKKILLFVAAAFSFAACVKIETPTNPVEKKVCQFDFHVDGLKVAFENTSTSNLMFNHWEFGDGTNSATENVTHTYANAGKYTVVLVCYDGSTKYTCTQVITVSSGNSGGGGGGQGEQDPDANKTVYLKGYKVYNLPQDGWYRFVCNFTGFMAESVSAGTDDIKIKKSELPRTLTYTTPKNLGLKGAFILNYSAVSLEVSYSKYDISFDKIFSADTMALYYHDEYIVTDKTGSIKVGVLVELQ